MGDYRKYFRRFVKENYPADFYRILVATDSHYRLIAKDIAFVKSSKNPIDKRLDFSAYFLALIKTLDEKGESFEAIRKICLDITTEYVRPTSKVQSFFKRLVPRLTVTWLVTTLIKAFINTVSSNPHPERSAAHTTADRK